MGDDEGAQKYLNRTAGSWAEDLSHKDPRHRRAAAYALGKVGTAAIPHIPTLKLVLQQDPDETVRTAVVHLLAELGKITPKGVIPSLIQSMNSDKDLAVRRAAVQGLGRLGDRATEAEPYLRHLLKEKDTLLRQHAVSALGQLGQAAAPSLTALTELLSDTNAEIRRETLAALFHLGSSARDSLPEITGRLSDNDRAVREQAVQTLGGLGPLAFSSVSALLNVAESADNSTNLRESALFAVQQIWPTGAKADQIWDRINRLAETDNDDQIRKSARKVMRMIAPRRRD